MQKSKIGIALGGGAARGWAHIGVLKKLAEYDIVPDIIAGTSMGAVVGGCYAANKIDTLEEFALSLTRRRVFGLLDFNFAGSGLISGQRLCDGLDVHLEHIDIEEMEREFVAVATEYGTGHEIWLDRGRLVDAMRASYALPGIFRPVKIGGRWLFDGALVNPVPVSVCRAHGAQVVIAVNPVWETFGRGAVIPNQEARLDPVEGIDEPNPPEGNGRSAMRVLHRQFFGKRDGAPGISSVMVDAFNIIQDRIARSRLAGDPPDITISPKLSGIGLFDFHRASEAIARGEEAVEREFADVSGTVSSFPAQPVAI